MRSHSSQAAWFFWRNHNSLPRIATNEIASFCINSLRQMAFSVCLEKWAKAGFEQLSCSSLFPYYIKQIDSMLQCVCLVIDHRGHQNVVRSVTHSAIVLCAILLFLSHHDVTCSIYLRNRTYTVFLSSFSINLLAFYHKCCTLIGYATHYLFCDI